MRASQLPGDAVRVAKHVGDAKFFQRDANEPRIEAAGQRDDERTIPRIGHQALEHAAMRADQFGDSRIVSRFRAKPPCETCNSSFAYREEAVLRS